MPTTAYGSITIVDIGDLGELSVTPQSNQPIMVIYDPDSNSYSPNWGDSNLVLTPVVYYGAQCLLDRTSTSKPTGLNISWQKQEGSGDPQPISSGIGADGKLTINTNPFNPSSISLITYLVSVSYTEPNSGVILNASGQITFSLVQNASKTKSATITGESVFKYNSSNTPLVSSITLTAIVKNTTIQNWQYKNNNGSFVNISEATGTTLEISESDTNYFNNDIAVIRLQTADPDVYDEHTIFKIRDGANGTSTISVVLSNEDQMVPCDANNNPVSGWETNCTTSISIYSGNKIDYTGWTITVDQSNGVTGNWNPNSHVFSATGISANTGYVTFTCTRQGYDTVTKTFSLTKVKSGADGTSPIIYSLNVDSLAVNKNINKVYNPATINITANSQEGNKTAAAYAGRFKIYLDGSSTASYSSSSDQSSISYTIPNTVTKNIRIELYKAGGFTKKLDSQTVVITSDGATGAQGIGGLSFVLGNYSDVIPCTSGGLVAQATTINIPFAAYKGIERQACTATYSGVPTGVGVTVTDCTKDADGKITLNIPNNNALGGAAIINGTITITLTSNSISNIQTYTWTKNPRAENGADAVTFQLYSPNGGVISNSENSVDVKPQLNDGATDKTESQSVSYEWKYYDGTSYKSCSGVTGYTITGNRLTIAPEAVNSYVSIKCTASYNSKFYDAYFSVYDKTDPIQVTVLSTLGDKLINSVGKGILYTKVFRNGVEIDPIVTTNCGLISDRNKLTPTKGNYFWLLDDENTKVILQQYNGSTWVNVATDPHSGKYKWSAIDSTGSAVSLTKTTGKAQYLSGSVVESKTIFNVEVKI